MRTRIIWRIPKADAAMWRACGWNIYAIPRKRRRENFRNWFGT